MVFVKRREEIYYIAVNSKRTVEEHHNIATAVLLDYANRSWSSRFRVRLEGEVWSASSVWKTERASVTHSKQRETESERNSDTSKGPLEVMLSPGFCFRRRCAAWTAFCRGARWKNNTVNSAKASCNYLPYHCHDNDDEDGNGAGTKLGRSTPSQSALSCKTVMVELAMLRTVAMAILTTMVFFHQW